MYGIAQKISSYDYERLTYIFKKIVEITESEDARIVAEDNVSLLEMLNMYQRTGSAVCTGTCVSVCLCVGLSVWVSLFHCVSVSVSLFFSLSPCVCLCT